MWRTRPATRWATPASSSSPARPTWAGRRSCGRNTRSAPKGASPRTVARPARPLLLAEGSPPLLLDLRCPVCGREPTVGVEFVAVPDICLAVADVRGRRHVRRACPHLGEAEATVLRHPLPRVHRRGKAVREDLCGQLLVRRGATTGTWRPVRHHPVPPGQSWLDLPERESRFACPVLWLLMNDSAIEITADLVRELVQEQHPDLAGLAIREVAGGWGNQMWRLGDELAVRMPRTEDAPDLLRKECRWLPVLAPRLPLPVPTPVRIGEPSARFPRPWTIMTWVPGEPLDCTSISRGDHAADALAGFLRALHVEAPAEAPASSDRGAHPKECTDGFERFLQAIAPGGI